MNFKVWNQQNLSVGFARNHKDEVKDIQISNERASFIVKSIMADVRFQIFTDREERILKGHEILAAINKCIDNELVFEGPMFSEINGKTWKELTAMYRSLLEERPLNVAEMDIYSTKEDIEYFIENIFFYAMVRL